MEILRLPPYSLTVTFTGLTVSTDHVLRLFDSRSGLTCTVGGTTDTSGDVTFILPSIVEKYDGEYDATVYEATLVDAGGSWVYDTSSEYVSGYSFTLADVDQEAIDQVDLVAQDTIKVVRPYLIPSAIAPTQSVEDIALYTKYERYARTAIDSIVNGFYINNNIVELQGQGTDKLFLGNRANSLISVVKNNVTEYVVGGTSNETEYTLSPDRQYILIDTTESKNLIDSLYQPARIIYPDFPLGYNYTVRATDGWSFVPNDIKDATQMLVDDLACESPNYIDKYIREYETKDFKVDMHRPGFNGTGNRAVDKILEKYVGDTLYTGLRVL